MRGTASPAAAPLTMVFPSPPPSGLQFSWTALLFLWLLGGVHHGTCLSIDTPTTLAECDITEFVWEGGQAPFTLNIHFHNNNSLLEEFTDVTDSPLFWQARAPAGSQLYLEILDSSGSAGAFSGTFPVQPGNDTCIQYSTANYGTTTGKGISPLLKK